MMRVGLTGGIAAGKSVACTRFHELGITVIDYDQLSRDVVEPGTPGLNAVVDAFGEEFLAPDGSLDRVKLGHAVFTDDEGRQRLEQIIHPLVIAEGQRLDVEATTKGERMVVHDVPLLVEAIGIEPFDAVIVVDAPVELRVERLIKRGLTEAQAWARIDSQAPEDVRIAAADVVFDGSGTEENLCHQVDEWVASVLGSLPTSR